MKMEITVAVGIGYLHRVYPIQGILGNDGAGNMHQKSGHRVAYVAVFPDPPVYLV